MLEVTDMIVIILSLEKDKKRMKIKTFLVQHFVIVWASRIHFSKIDENPILFKEEQKSSIHGNQLAHWKHHVTINKHKLIMI